MSKEITSIIREDIDSLKKASMLQKINTAERIINGIFFLLTGMRTALGRHSKDISLLQERLTALEKNNA